MRENKYYNLATKDEIPDDNTRLALNCYNASLVKCDERLSHKCKEMDYKLWLECPNNKEKN
jgi:hypothetical protein